MTACSPMKRRPSPLDEARVRDLVARGGTILGAVNRGNPFVRVVENADGTVDYVDTSGEALARMERHGHRRADRRGRRWHDGDCAKAGRARRARGRRAQDHRQRPEPDRRDLRLRHGDPDGDRSARQAANHRRKPSPRHGHGSDGAQFRLAGADCRRGGRRGRDPDPGNPVRHSAPSATGSKRHARRAITAWSWSRKALRRSAARRNTTFRAAA